MTTGSLKGGEIEVLQAKIVQQLQVTISRLSLEVASILERTRQAGDLHDLITWTNKGSRVTRIFLKKNLRKFKDVGAVMPLNHTF